MRSAYLASPCNFARFAETPSGSAQRNGKDNPKPVCFTWFCEELLHSVPHDFVQNFHLWLVVLTGTSSVSSICLIQDAATVTGKA
jgi:hypothetical protein